MGMTKADQLRKTVVDKILAWEGAFDPYNQYEEHKD